MDGRDRKTHSDCWGVGSPPQRPGEVGGPSWWPRGVTSGRKALLEGWEWSGGVRGVGRASQRSGSGREGREGLGGPPVSSGVVRRDGRGWEGLQEGREGLVVLPGGQGGLGAPPVGSGRDESPSWRARSDREALSKGREGSGGPPEGPVGLGMPSRRVGRSQKAHPDGRRVWKSSQKGQEESGAPHRGWEGWDAFLEGQNWSGGPSRGPGGVGVLPGAL